MTTTYVQVPRVVCEYPLGVELPAGAPRPVRARDDLDPHAPPLEYDGGRISWSGHDSREERDAVQAAEAESLARRRADMSPLCVATRKMASAYRVIGDAADGLASRSITRERAQRIQEGQREVIHAAASRGGSMSQAALYDAGECWYAHDRRGSCRGCTAGEST